MPDVFTFDQAASRTVPGAVQALAILLAIGGVLAVGLAVFGLVSGDLLRNAVALLLGLLYLGLARFVQQGRRWARATLAVLCAAGLAIGAYRLAAGAYEEGAAGLIWSTVYALLLSTRATREWFRTGGQEDPAG